MYNITSKFRTLENSSHNDGGPRSPCLRKKISQKGVTRDIHNLAKEWMFSKILEEFTRNQADLYISWTSIEVLPQ